MRAEDRPRRAEDKLTYAGADGKSYCVDYTISELQEKLDPKKFARIHRGTLVNIDWIKEITPMPRGGLNVRLKDASGTYLAVSRDRARDLKARLF
jgi:two-component system, LytTR family, response regulator